MRDFATRVADSPVPISKILFVFNLSTFSSASFTAIEPTDTPPLLIPVEFLTLVPILIALSNRVLRCSPENFDCLATVMDFFICPRICSSPKTIESRPEVNFNK